MSWLKLFLACALLSAPALIGQTPVPAGDAAGKKSDAAAPKASSDDDKKQEMLATIPVGQTFHGVHIPNYGPNGKLLMLLDATSAKRVNDRNFEMQDLKIEIHNNDGTNFQVQMAKSIFNADTNILTSNTPTTIKSDDFVINGESAEFHVKERFGRVFGNIKMVIDSGDKNSKKHK